MRCALYSERFFSDWSIKSNIVINVYIISHTFRNSSLDYEQTIRKLNLGVNCLMYLPVHEQRRLAPARVRLALYYDHESTI